MCETRIVSSPLAPIVGRFALGLGAVVGVGVAVQMVPAVVLWLIGALALVSTWAAIATILLIRQRADTKLAAREQAVAPPAPARAHAEILASRDRRPELAAAAPDLTASTIRTAIEETN
jgi:uncharacterized membrane protein (Fun14 family)